MLGRPGPLPVSSLDLNFQLEVRHQFADDAFCIAKVNLVDFCRKIPKRNSRTRYRPLRILESRNSLPRLSSPSLGLETAYEYIYMSLIWAWLVLKWVMPKKGYRHSVSHLLQYKPGIVWQEWQPWLNVRAPKVSNYASFSMGWHRYPTTRRKVQPYSQSSLKMMPHNTCTFT